MTDKPHSYGDFGPFSMAPILRRQIAELEVARTKLLPRGENPDDNDGLRNAVFEIRAFRKTLDGIEEDLQGERDGKA